MARDDAGEWPGVLGCYAAMLLVLTAMICVVSGISILVSIYNSMSERRQEVSLAIAGIVIACAILAIAADVLLHSPEEPRT